ncbi:hypothetical protein ACQKWADRAFT_215017 [Trichoderma austrokoningii]
MLKIIALYTITSTVWDISASSTIRYAYSSGVETGICFIHTSHLQDEVRLVQLERSASSLWSVYGNNNSYRGTHLYSMQPSGGLSTEHCYIIILLLLFLCENGN